MWRWEQLKLERVVRDAWPSADACVLPVAEPAPMARGAMTRPRGHVRVPGSMPLGEAEGACDCVSKQASRPRSPNLTGGIESSTRGGRVHRTNAGGRGRRPAGRPDGRALGAAPLPSLRRGPGRQSARCVRVESIAAHASSPKRSGHMRAIKRASMCLAISGPFFSFLPFFFNKKTISSSSSSF